MTESMPDKVYDDASTAYYKRWNAGARPGIALRVAVEIAYWAGRRDAGYLGVPVIDLQGELCAWLTLNGVDPNDVAIPLKLEFGHQDYNPDLPVTHMRVEVFDRNERGQPQVDPFRPLRVLRKTIIVPVEVPPPPRVASYLRLDKDTSCPEPDPPSPPE